MATSKYGCLFFSLLQLISVNCYPNNPLGSTQYTDQNGMTNTWSQTLPPQGQQMDYSPYYGYNYNSQVPQQTNNMYNANNQQSPYYDQQYMPSQPQYLSHEQPYYQSPESAQSYSMQTSQNTQPYAMETPRVPQSYNMQTPQTTQSNQMLQNQLTVTQLPSNTNNYAQQLQYQPLVMPNSNIKQNSNINNDQQTSPKKPQVSTMPEPQSPTNTISQNPSISATSSQPSPQDGQKSQSTPIPPLLEGSQLQSPTNLNQPSLNPPQVIPLINPKKEQTTKSLQTLQEQKPSVIIQTDSKLSSTDITQNPLPQSPELKIIPNAEQIIPNSNSGNPLKSYSNPADLNQLPKSEPVLSSLPLSLPLSNPPLPQPTQPQLPQSHPQDGKNVQSAPIPPLLEGSQLQSPTNLNQPSMSSPQVIPLINPKKEQTNKLLQEQMPSVIIQTDSKLSSTDITQNPLPQSPELKITPNAEQIIPKSDSGKPLKSYLNPTDLNQLPMSEPVLSSLPLSLPLSNPSLPQPTQPQLPQSHPQEGQNVQSAPIPPLLEGSQLQSPTNLNQPSMNSPQVIPLINPKKEQTNKSLQTLQEQKPSVIIQTDSKLSTTDITQNPLPQSPELKIIPNAEQIIPNSNSGNPLKSYSNPADLNQLPKSEPVLSSLPLSLPLSNPPLPQPTQPQLPQSHPQDGKNVQSAPIPPLLEGSQLQSPTNLNQPSMSSPQVIPLINPKKEQTNKLLQEQMPSVIIQTDSKLSSTDITQNPLPQSPELKFTPNAEQIIPNSDSGKPLKSYLNPTDLNQLPKSEPVLSSLPLSLPLSNPSLPQPTQPQLPQSHPQEGQNVQSAPIPPLLEGSQLQSPTNLNQPSMNSPQVIPLINPKKEQTNKLLQTLQEQKPSVIIQTDSKLSSTDITQNPLQQSPELKNTAYTSQPILGLSQSQSSHTTPQSSLQKEDIAFQPNAHNYIYATVDNSNSPSDTLPTKITVISHPQPSSSYYPWLYNNADTVRVQQPYSYKPPGTMTFNDNMSQNPMPLNLMPMIYTPYNKYNQLNSMDNTNYVNKQYIEPIYPPPFSTSWSLPDYAQKQQHNNQRNDHSINHYNSNSIDIPLTGLSLDNIMTDIANTVQIPFHGAKAILEITRANFPNAQIIQQVSLTYSVVKAVVSGIQKIMKSALNDLGFQSQPVKQNVNSFNLGDMFTDPVKTVENYFSPYVTMAENDYKIIRSEITGNANPRSQPAAPVSKYSMAPNGYLYNSNNNQLMAGSDPNLNAMIQQQQQQHHIPQYHYNGGSTNSKTDGYWTSTNNNNNNNNGAAHRPHQTANGPSTYVPDVLASEIKAAVFANIPPPYTSASHEANQYYQQVLSVVGSVFQNQIKSGYQGTSAQ